ncbi:MAG: hypothetical protein Sapg2KO_46920 [Saprospiraceae bacterium]
MLFSGLSLMAQVQLNSSVFSNGAINATAGNLRLQGSIGQAITGPVQANSIIANGGFWARGAAACGDPVTSLADSGEGSLREAVACAVTGDTIKFSIFGSIVLTSGPIEITQGIVIDPGNNSVIIDAEGNSRIFTINTTDEVVLRNLVLQRGSTDEFGGAIFGEGSLSAINCNFNNNQAENGGVISMGEGDLNLINCSIGFNRANSQTGAVLFFNGNANIVNTVFNQNSSGVAGSALTLANINEAKIINSTFYGNLTSTTAGAIWVANTNLELYNSLFQDNTGPVEAPDVYNDPNSTNTITANNVIMGSVNGSGLTPGVNNVVELDALLSAPNSFDFSLQPFSPAHGNADPSLLPIDNYDADNDGDTTDPIDFDLFGNPRGSTDGCNFDIGAVETAQGSLTVLNNNDSGIGSLRSHMECANANLNIDQISFAISGDGPHTINLASDLPFITDDDVVIDGTSQSGSTIESPNINIDGGGITSSILSVAANNVSILGMALRNITGFRVIEVAGDFVTISGNTIFTNAGQDQIALFNSNNCNIFSNRIGIDVDGTPSTLDRPLLWLDNSSNNRISLNTISGVGGSISLGIVNGSRDNEVFDNLIGTTEDGLAIGGGTGILLANAFDNAITNNVIANHNVGISVLEGANGNTLSPNDFLCNINNGISIEAGSQFDIAPPVFRGLSPGVIAGIAIGGATVDIYVQDNSQCPDAACQGNFFRSVTADGNGDWILPIPNDINLDGAIVTAIQTDANNNSSAFATCSLVACELTAEVVTPVQINCTTPFIALQASSNGIGVTFTWTGPNGFTSTEQNPTVDEAGIYNLAVTDLLGCEQTASIVVNGDFQQPDISVIGAQLDCNNPTTILSGNSTTPGATFSWTGPNGFTADIRNPEISEPGDYVFTVTGPNGCTSSGPLTVTRDETVAPVAGFETEITTDLEVNLQSTATGDPFSHFYDFGNGQTSTDLNPSITYQSPGIKTITQIVANQCGSDTVEVMIELLPPAGAVSFCFPEKSEGAIGEILDIPVKVTNFNNVASLQMSIKTGDPAVAQILSVGNFALPDLDENDFNVINDTTVSMAWFFGNGASLPDSTVIFTVQVLLTATDALCTPIFIDNSPVFVEVGVLDQNVNSIVSAPFQIVPGEVCILPIANISGQVFRETGDGLKEVLVECTDQNPVTTGPDGLYEFLELQTGLDYLVSPSRNTNPVEGVTAIDLALIQRHILTLQFLDSPYKIIAADVDSSNSVGAIDLANIQRLILGRTDVFPNNMPSWRFTDANYQFSDPNNPFADAIPKDRLVVDLRTDVTDVDFVGMKLGDVNGSALGRQIPTPLDLLLVETIDGNERTVEFRVKEAQALAAYQFDINFDPGQMQLLEITPGNLPGINDNSFAFHQIAEGIIPTLWYDPSGNPAGYTLEEGQVLFSLKFKGAATLPDLKERVWADAKTMPAIAYTGTGGEMQINTVYLQNTETPIEQEIIKGQVYLEALRPNPFSDQTQMRFYIPEAAVVDIQVRDALGRTVKSIQRQFDAGEHRVAIQSTDLGPSGWYVVQLRTGDFSTSRRIILQRQ